MRENQFHFTDQDVAGIAGEAARQFGLALAEADVRGAGATVSVKGESTALERFASYAADLGGEDVTLVSYFYGVPHDSLLSPDELLEAARNHNLRAVCPDDPDYGGNRQLEVRDQQRVHQERFAAFLADLGINRVQ